MTGPPAALLEFLGEAPSVNAIRHHSSDHPSQQHRPAVPSSARRRARNDDDSSDDDDSAPTYDGGFDNAGIDALKAPVPKAEPVPELSVPKAEKEKTKRPSSRGERVPPQKEQKPPRPAGPPVGIPDAPSSKIIGGYSQGASPALSRSRSVGTGDKASLGQTSTPFPSSMQDVMGDGATHAARRSSTETPPPGYQKQMHRSSSGSRSSISSDKRGKPPPDPLNSSGGKVRFGGRG
eukprot:gnl/MRDRNA2_/MRDRNA2_111011_c0_seq1.p1 gnl/MRDRNA2_/MRDRNA2_111011_c0~~gnl/MRDRNA2_/MRDRNA2_111011_c0_seq1.p1  ORF type:complete len:235 (+),score=40.94 gnl/MRDRNA2_/MRDRNA2_111011_c0_seq1:66-770(+)